MRLPYGRLFSLCYKKIAAIVAAYVCCFIVAVRVEPARRWGYFIICSFLIAHAPSGVPPFRDPLRVRKALFDRPSINSFGNSVWAQGPRHSVPSPRTEAICSRRLVRGAWVLDLGPPLAVDRFRLFLDTPREFESRLPGYLHIANPR